ncbi:MAG: 50S ribosomal protein L18e [Candidatus Altiarchaeota archaeon]|nr:50S ribosomal protein L18e [Candidatus Altiarchaeota archaeon]
MALRKRIKKRNFTEERINSLLKDLSRSKVKFWEAVAKKLSTPRSNRVAVNLSKLERFVGDDFELLVPGKVLGVGNLSKKVTISAYAFSSSAADKIEAAGGTIKTIEESRKDNSQAKKIKMVI